jgi:hypothetical protein
VNLGQFFFDNILTEDRLMYKETSSFLKFFKEFSKKYITTDKFEKNEELGCVNIKDPVLNKTLMCLFEGLTRKIPAFHFLKFIYAGPFSKMRMFDIENDICKNAKQQEEERKNLLEKMGDRNSRTDSAR